MTNRPHESRQSAVLEDQQTCFADLLSIDDLIALTEWANQ